MTSMNSSAAGTRRASTPTWILLAVLAWMAGTWYFYRGFFRSGFGVTQGDNGDGRLTEVIAGHWRDPFQFAGGLTDIGIFYPFGQGLMYSDTMMLFGIITISFVGIGIDPSVAFQLSLIVATTIGYFSTLVLLRIGPRSPWVIAIGASFLVAFSNGLLVASNHPQLLALPFLPLVLVLYLLAIRATSRTSVWLLASSSGLLFSAITYTTFAIGWFAILGFSLTIIIWLVLARSRPAVQHLLGPRGGTALSFVAGSIPMAILFAFTYLPLLLQNASRSLSEVENYALAPADLFAVSPTNSVWFRPLYAIFGGMSDTEKAMAPTPLLLVSAVALLIAAVISRRRRDPWLALGSSTIVAGLILWLAPVSWGSFFPWQVVHTLIPGADAIRAIGRMELMAGFLLTLGSATTAGLLWRYKRRRRLATGIVVALVGLILLEQANFLVQQNVEVAAVQAIRATQAPPAVCTSFVLLPPFPVERAENGQIDAAIIAQTHSLPTWNGSSGGFPPGWSLLGMDEPDTYLEKVDEYQTANNLQGACAISLADGTWVLR